MKKNGEDKDSNNDNLYERINKKSSNKMKTGKMTIHYILTRNIQF